MARRAIRAFTDEPVPRVTRECVPATSARSPSGGNLQPWRTCVVTGAPLGNVRPGAPRPGPRGRTGVPDVSADLKSPYHERRSAAAARRFGAPLSAALSTGRRSRRPSRSWAAQGRRCVRERAGLRVGEEACATRPECGSGALYGPARGLPLPFSRRDGQSGAAAKRRREAWWVMRADGLAGGVGRVGRCWAAGRRTPCGSRRPPAAGRAARWPSTRCRGCGSPPPTPGGSSSSASSSTASSASWAGSSSSPSPCSSPSSSPRCCVPSPIS
ncbi:nitroreductase family protein [Streptomyces griseochromogenes]|uniref:nitroreductase family protein n=1 Tax=Streptomyces griseochromogenes TaxID=68214 RepID=UPI0009A09538